MAQLVGIVGTHAQLRLGDAEVDVPLVAGAAPVLVPLQRLVGRHEELEFHLLELASAEHEVARRDLVPEGLPDLGDAERRLLAAGLEHVAEVHKHALCGLGAQVGNGGVGLDGAGVGLEHEVEVAGLGEGVRATAARAGGEVVELILAEPFAAGPAVDQRVGEVLEVAGGLPDGGR